MKNKILVLLSIFVFCFMTLVPISLSFTEEEQTEIDEIVTTLVNNSKNNGVTWQIDLSSSATRVAFFQTDFSYENQQCKYLGIMYWNNQFNVTFTNNTITAKHNTGQENEFCYYYYNSDLELIAAKSSSFSSGSSGSVTISGVNNCFYSQFTLYDSSGVVIELSYTPRFTAPFFISKDEFANGDVDVLEIDAGSFDYTDSEPFYLLIFECFTLSSGDTYSEFCKSFVLDDSSSFFYTSYLEVYYYIPFDELGISVENGQTYSFSLSDGGSVTYDDFMYQISDLTEEEEQDKKDDLTHQKMDEQTDAIKEQTEVNKGIWDTLKDFVNLFNPFSDNFIFKIIFVPSDNFFIDWINDLNDYFGDRFGIIYYPFELIINFLTRVGDISNGDYSTAVIKFGDLKLFDTVLINGFEFDFFSLLTNDTLKNIHDIYLLCVDVILYLGLILLAKNTFVEIFGGHFVDEVVSDFSNNKNNNGGGS